MDGMTFLGFVLIVAVGISVPAIVLELLSPLRQMPATEEAKHVPAGLPAESMASSIPAFFARPYSDQLPLATVKFDDAALLALLQNHVKAERALVNEFVHFPSVDSLYARPSLTLH
jgi:hypothetical protein